MAAPKKLWRDSKTNESSSDASSTKENLDFRTKTSTDGELNQRILCYVTVEVYESQEKVKESFGNR